MGLLLRAVDVAGPLKWRWLLTDEETGAPFADHRVDLDPASDEVVRFRDLYGYVRSRAALDRRTEDGTRFVTAAGEWAGRELLGESVASVIAGEAPVTVRVKVPVALDSVLMWPLELAHVAGKPLAARGDVTLVYDIAPEAPVRRKDEVGVTLRMLAVFSQPTRTGVLALRRERHALSQLIRRIAGRERAMVQLQLVQYGVTRERLEKIADSQDGWDVLHLAGHGTGGVFVLERDDGSPDLVPARDLVALLRPVRRRVKLAVVSACKSAADTTAETLRLIGLTEQAETVEAESGEQAGAQVPGLARAMARELDCAVVAMRYPVTDDFAIAFGDVFYEHLLGRRQPVDVAVARALAKAAGPVPSAARPAVSLATSAVFGARSAGLRLAVPRGEPVMDPASKKMAHFDPPYGPGEPERFVGRAEAMAKANEVLASGSGRTTVLFHGMTGAGKTACAMELVYRNEDRFAVAAFWQAPTRADQWPGALADFANRLDIQLGGYGLTIAGHVGTVAALKAFLPRLRRVIADSGVLLVLDNLETLLTPEGGWRDPRWEMLITALTSHDGESRVILTSRVTPAEFTAGPTTGHVVTLPVHALTLGEAVALARELPNLRKLLHADPGPMRAVAGGTADRDRVRRVLQVVQGHPKLMELADAAAADRDRLDVQLAAAEGAAAGQGLEAFFRDGKSTLDPGQFLDALTTWTVTTLGVLSPQARLMAQFVACLEGDDRVSDVVEATWPGLWRRLDSHAPEHGPGSTPAAPRADNHGDVPEPGPLLAALAASALVEAELAAMPAAGGDAPPGDGPGQVACRMHPGVAAAIMAQAGPGIREAVDADLAAFWKGVADEAREGEGGEDSGLVVRAGLAAAPYLLRRGDWGSAGALLEHAVVRDVSPGFVQAVLPSLRRIAAATGTPLDAVRLARALSSADPEEAGLLLRGAVTAAAENGDYRAASAAAGSLVDLLLASGMPRDALEAAGQVAEYVERGGFGPWTRLVGQARQLQVLERIGKHDQVLAEVDRLRADMASLPDHRGHDEAVHPWDVRESILDSGRFSALATGDWQRSLNLNAGVVASMQQRGAGIHDVTVSRFRDVGPLVELGRLAEAEGLLAECQPIFEDNADMSILARVFNARAGLEAALGHGRAASDLGRTSLRMFYARPEPEDIAIGHHDLADFLGKLGDDRAGQRAHSLAAALIFQLAGMDHYLEETVRGLADELRHDGDVEGLPTTVAQVLAVAEQAEGVRLGVLLKTLQPAPQALERALAEILRKAHESAALQGDYSD